jgi:hypothetical protein
MALNRNTGLALGFGIGIVIAGGFFGTNWMMKNGGNLLKTQALQNIAPSASPTIEPIQEDIATPPATPTADPTDTIVNRIAPSTPSQSEVINDIQKNLQELYGTNKPQ